MYHKAVWSLGLEFFHVAADVAKFVALRYAIFSDIPPTFSGTNQWQLFSAKTMLGPVFAGIVAMACSIPACWFGNPW